MYLVRCTSHRAERSLANGVRTMSSLMTRRNVTRSTVSRPSSRKPARKPSASVLDSAPLAEATESLPAVPVVTEPAIDPNVPIATVTTQGVTFKVPPAGSKMIGDRSLTLPQLQSMDSTELKTFAKAIRAADPKNTKGISGLNKAQLAEYVYSGGQSFPIKQLTERGGVSRATLVDQCKAAGLKGYTKYNRAEMAEFLANPLHPPIKIYGPTTVAGLKQYCSANKDSIPALKGYSSKGRADLLAHMVKAGLNDYLASINLM